MGVALRIYFLKNITKGMQEKGQPSHESATSRHFTVDTKNKQRKRPLAGDTEGVHTTGISNVWIKPAATFLSKADFHWCIGVVH